MVPLSYTRVLYKRLNYNVLDRAKVVAVSDSDEKERRAKPQVEWWKG